MGRLNGKVAIISGGARGMGATHARRFVAEGAKVVIGDVLDAEGEAVAAELGADARYVGLDVTSYPDWQAAVGLAEREFGRLDILVNNAGIARWAPIEEHTIETWHRVLDVNLTGAFYGIKAVIEPLKRSGAGSIINISSTAGIQGNAALSSYTATKWGLRGLSKSVALDLGRYNIRVNSVHPGRIDSPINAEQESTAMATLALGRPGRLHEVTDLLVYLASDEASYATGAEFIIDGGLTAGLAPR